MLLRNWNIAPRAAIGFGLIALMVAFLGIFSLATMSSIRDRASSHELSRLAADLSRLVGRFSV